MDDGDVYEDASVSVVEGDVRAPFIILVKVAGFRLRRNSSIIEGGDKKVANEVVSKDGGATFDDGAGEEVRNVVMERLGADAETREWSGGWKREAKHG